VELLRNPSLAAALGAAGEQRVNDAWATAAARVSDALAESATVRSRRGD